MNLSKEEIARYSRQLVLPEVGVRGQQRLLESTVFIVGAGGLGSPAALYLAAGGVGTIAIADSDPVELNNLHRQILHGTQDVGRPKVASAADRLADINPAVRIISTPERLSATNILERIASADLVLDGSDNFPTRYLVNDACVLAGKPLVHAGVVRFEGQVLTVLPRRSACFRCVFPEPPDLGAIPNCQEAGVLGAAAGIIGCLAAFEALKVLLQVGQPLADRMLVFDGLKTSFREVPVRRDPACAVCGDHPTITTPTEDGAVCGTSRACGATS